MTALPPDEPDYSPYDDDPDAPQACDLTNEDDEYDTATCPHCGAEISELAEQCPHCGDWIIPGATPAYRRPGVLLVAVVLIVLLLLWVF